MEINAYQIPPNNDIYIQQNLVTDISKNTDYDSFHIFANQSISYKQVLGQNLFPTTTEVGIELNHYFQTSMFCSSTFQNFFIDDKQKKLIDNFWYCGNALAVVPFASSVIHPKFKIYGGAGQAYGTDNTNSKVPKSLVLYYWSLKPTALAEFNISESFKFSLGAAYQLVFSNDSSDLATNTSGLEGTASISYNFK
ncbi:hypothetical protein [Silvanigrella sp.]|jgi:hypothetical protein|uniref:hypothetical protein n=1 Tax=Silvanigrella sp. TaxID=2024976 RepID=UPI0037CC3088